MSCKTVLTFLFLIFFSLSTPSICYEGKLSPIAVTPKCSQIMVGFSPEGSAVNLVINTIRSAKSEICMMAYSFTSPKIMKALLDAKKRGVNVRIVVDKNGNTGTKSIQAMNLMVNSDIKLRVDDKYRIQHDKVLITDSKNVQTGSFNYTASADKHNSENVILILGNSELASVYKKHFESRWQQAVPFHSTY